MTTNPADVVPLTAWEQISVVVVFGMLLGGLGYFLVRMFTKAIADINAHYRTVIGESNDQWRKYFDARSESSNLILQEHVKSLNEILRALNDIMNRFDSHSKKFDDHVVAFREHDKWERDVKNRSERDLEKILENTQK